jgi:hypothetical protein
MMRATSERTPLLYRGSKRVDEWEGGSPSSGYPADAKERKSGVGVYRRVRPLSKLLQCGSLLSARPMDDDMMYEDHYNDDPVRCSCGTKEEDGVWLNHSDRLGTIMCATVWVLFLYSAFTVVLLAQSGHSPKVVAAVYCTLCALALACHIKTCLTDPGSIPSSAVPITTNAPHYIMCSVCQTYKPERAHHCRICNRCISRMDHHCPWMNTCIGASSRSETTRSSELCTVPFSPTFV